MDEASTEKVAKTSVALDLLPVREVAETLFRSQRGALDAVAGATVQIAAAATLLAKTLTAGGRVVYAGAGTSGLMAMADALELPLTYGIDPHRIVILLAGGLPSGPNMPGGHDDDAKAAARDAARIKEGDIVIAVSASGSTPYTMEVARLAKSRGGTTVAIACDAQALIFGHADVAVRLPTKPEPVAGSTRMGAGTAQKVALNMVSTMAGIALGHVHDGMMVNFVADNMKLRRRAVRTVTQIAGVDDATAKDSLLRCGWQAKVAVLVCAGMSLGEAKGALEVSGGSLRGAMCGK